MDSADLYFAELLKTYKKMKKQQTHELATLPEGRLRVRKERGNTNYIQYFHDDVKTIRRGITNNKQLVYALARKKYLQVSLGILEKNIFMLEKLSSKHADPTAKNILTQMTEALQELPIEIYLPELRRKNAWAEEPYEKSNYKSEQKTHTTGSGLKVRSKSEVVIAEKLDTYNIPYRYEQMLYIENHSFSPDFTIMTSKGLVYWEHCGLVNDRAYMSNHKWKVNMYEKIGIFPWKNLIVTYDDEEGNLDSRVIESEIVNKL